jgi:hypothetical protein
MITPNDASDLLAAQVATIDDELDNNPAPARRQQLEASRTTLMAQLDTIDEEELDSGARAVRAAADALQAVVLSGSTDPLAIIFRQLREAGQA